MSTDWVGKSSHSMVMTEELPAASEEVAVQFESFWLERLDALIAGSCGEDEFLDAVAALASHAPDSAWTVLSLLDQRYRRGQMSAELFLSIETKIARRQLRVAQYGVTIDLLPLDETDPASVGDEAGGLDTHSVLPVLEEPVAATRVARPATSLRMGDALRDRYMIETRLGSGGMGTVYKALDRTRRAHAAPNFYVALKILHQETSRRPEVLAKLRREFYCAQALSHRAVIKVFELDRDRDLDFFTMELLVGKPLNLVIAQSQPQGLARNSSWRLIEEIGAGVAHAHSRNVVHADLKPQNIMIMPSDEVRILDFGASSDSVRHATKATSVTPAYASFEMLSGQQADPRDDLYALACISYEILTGSHPFEQQRSSEARKKGLIAARPPDLNDNQWEALLAGMAWMRGDRPASVHGWLSLLLPEARLPQPQAPRTRLPEQQLPEAQLQYLTRPRVTVLPWPGALRRITHLPVLIAALAVLGAGALGWQLLGAPQHSGMNGETPAEVATPAPPPDESDVAGADVDAAAAAATRSTAAGSTAPQARPVTVNDAPAPKTVVQKKPADGRQHIGMDAHGYRLAPEEKFAEVHVHRSSSAGRASFEWWTQADTAFDGTDFVPQQRTTAFFAPGKNTATLFVKLLPNAARKHTAMFYVEIAVSGAGVALDGAGKSAIYLAAR